MTYWTVDGKEKYVYNEAENSFTIVAWSGVVLGEVSELPPKAKLTGPFKCGNCRDTGEVKTYVGVGEDPDTTPCQECCPHNEFDHYICLDCGYEQDPGALIDAAMDRMEDR